VSAHIGALEEIQRVLDSGDEADDVLRQLVGILHEQLGHSIRISFVEGGSLVLGPAAGTEEATTRLPISFQGRHVADLEAGGEHSREDTALLERVAELVSPYAFVGWDTGGEEWTPYPPSRNRRGRPHERRARRSCGGSEPAPHRPQPLSLSRCCRFARGVYPWIEVRPRSRDDPSNE